MKVYEKLGLPYLTKEQYECIYDLCPAFIEGEDCQRRGCRGCVYDYLMSDVPVKKVKRWETYNGDFKKAINDWNLMCTEGVFKCSECEYHNHSWAHNTAGCFAYWLMQEIEVAEWA